MYGALLGDIIGSPFEFNRRIKSKDFPLFNSESQITDDSVMTVAVTEALLDLEEPLDDEAVKAAVVRSMQKWGRKYPRVGYGGRFFEWIFAADPQPYNSWGNGSGMRVSSVGWLYDTMEETRRVARLTAVVTHDHPEGIKGAEAVAAAVFLARTGRSKADIRQYIEAEFSYDLRRTCDDIRPGYAFDVSCQGSVPESIIAFMDGTDFEDVVRNGVSLGGDTDTIGSMAGSIAEAFYGVPEHLIMECRRRLPEEILSMVDRFNKAIEKNICSL